MLGAEDQASVLAERESGKKSAAAEEARDFFLPLCFTACKERGFRAPPKQTPETGASRSYQRGSHSNGCRGKNGEIPAQRLGAEQHSPAREACLLTCRGGQGLGAEAPASVLAGRESGKKSAAAEEARDFFLPLCFTAHKERGFRAPPK